MAFFEGDFRFVEHGNGYYVYQRRTFLGYIERQRERSGRCCFALGVDLRANPRTYRGRVIAANALRTIAETARRAKKKDWSLEETILYAWEDVPSGSPLKKK